MNVLRSALIMTLVVLLNSSLASAQSQTTGAYILPPAYAQPVYMPPTAIVPTDPFAACQCNPSNPGDCKCKNLDCKIRLPQNCKNVRGPYKTPVPCTVYGKVPKRTIKSCCAQKLFGFEYLTDVPEIQCITDYCNEIGKKTLECLPGCCFSVCVPLNECTTEKIECKLISKPMKMELWSRNENGQIKYDVYVINDKNPDSSYHAGGMPGRWLVLHCGSSTHFNNRFPGIDINTGASLGKLDKNIKPKATPADVDIELITDKAKIKEYMKKAETGEADAGETTAGETTAGEANARGRKFIAINKG